jgi:hypothetical protein
MRSSYRRSISFSCSVFSVCVALDALVVDVLLVVLDVCAVTGVLVDFSLVECMGTGIFVVGSELE